MRIGIDVHSIGSGNGGSETYCKLEPATQVGYSVVSLAVFLGQPPTLVFPPLS